jgi:hypothetical protein
MSEFVGSHETDSEVEVVADVSMTPLAGRRQVGRGFQG